MTAITGTAGNDTLAGTSGDDVIVGLDGNDVIEMGAGDNYASLTSGSLAAYDVQLTAGDGRDVIRLVSWGTNSFTMDLGGAGYDRLDGGDGPRRGRYCRGRATSCCSSIRPSLVLTAPAQRDYAVAGFRVTAW